MFGCDARGRGAGGGGAGLRTRWRKMTTALPHVLEIDLKFVDVNVDSLDLGGSKGGSGRWCFERCRWHVVLITRKAKHLEQ